MPCRFNQGDDAEIVITVEGQLPAQGMSWDILTFETAWGGDFGGYTWMGFVLQDLNKDFDNDSLRVSLESPLGEKRMTCTIVVCALVLTGDAKPNDVVEKLVQQLGHPSFRVRQSAYKQFRKLGLKAVPHLLQALRDDDLEVQRRALTLLQCAVVPEVTEQTKMGYVILGKMAQYPNKKASQWAFFLLFRGDLRGEEHAMAMLHQLRKSKTELVAGTKRRLFPLPKNQTTRELLDFIKLARSQIDRYEKAMAALPKTGQERFKKSYFEFKKNGFEKSLKKSLARVEILRYEVLGKMLDKMPNEGLPEIQATER